MAPFRESYPKGKGSLSSSLDSHYSLCLCRWCLCYYRYPIYPCHGAALCSCVRMAKWLGHTQPVLKWGYIKIRQHLRASGTEGNLLQYDSAIINSRMASQKLRKFSKWQPWWFPRLWNWVANLEHEKAISAGQTTRVLSLIQSGDTNSYYS